MTDDSTQDNWEPPADQPVGPDPAAAPGSPPPPGWTPPAYGPPPTTWAAPTGAQNDASSGAAPYGGPRPAYGNPYQPPYGNPYQPPYGNPYGTTGTVDYLQSPPPRRHRVLIGVVVVLLVIAATITAVTISVRNGSTKSSTASASAAPVVPSFPGQSSQPAPSAGGQPQASSGPLDSYLIAPSDLGSHTLMLLIDGGRSVTDEATLDFCGYHYTSEALRSARVQVEYVGGSQDASNEFVQYKPGGAASAYSEIQKAVGGCPSAYADKDSAMSQIQQLSNLTGLVKQHVAVEFAVATTGTDGNPVSEWSTVVYQFDGNYFSGLYVYGTDKTRVEQVGAQLATKAAVHLAEAAKGEPGTGGGAFTDPNGQPGPGAQA